jgi:hypothetical protein
MLLSLQAKDAYPAQQIWGRSGRSDSQLLSRLSKTVLIITNRMVPTVTAYLQHGKQYFFTSREAFAKDVAEGRFLEWAEVNSESGYLCANIPVLITRACCCRCTATCTAPA